MLAVLGPAALMLMVGAMGATTYGTLQAHSRQVAQTRDVIDRGRSVLVDLLDAETGERGFLITDDTQYLEPYQRGTVALRADTAALRALTRDDATQQRLLDRLTEVAAERVALLDTVKTRRQTDGPAVALKVFRQSRGKALMDSARVIIARIQDEEGRLLAAREAAESRAANRLIFALVAGAVLAALFAFLMNALLHRKAERIAASERLTSEQNELLQEQTLELELTNEQLHDQQAELEMQTEELQATAAYLEERTEALTESEARFRAVFERSRVGMARVSFSGARWLEVNDAFREMLGYTQDEFLATPWPEITHPDDVDSDLIPFGRMAVGDLEWYAVEKRFIHKFGHHVWARLTLSLVRDSAGRPDYEIAVIEDVSRQHAAAAERERLLAAEELARSRAETLQHISASLSAARTPADVAAATISAGIVAADASRAAVGLLDDDNGRTVELLAHSGYTEAQVARLLDMPMGGLLPLADLVRTRAAVLIGRHDETVVRYPAFAKWIDAAGFHGSAMFPLFVGQGAEERVLGYLGFGFERDREFTESEVAFLETVARLCSQALDRARAYNAAEAARHEAEAANRAKSQFLATMSHELRTPLNAIAGYADLMELELRGPLTELQRADLARIKVSGQHLLSLINDVLNFAKIEAGRLELQFSPASVSALVAGIDPLIAPQYGARGLAYAFECADDAVVWADAEKVQQILLNLLTNAGKFTAPGNTVTVQSEQDDHVVRIHVRDRGRGIPADKLDRIFEPFVQIDRHLTQASQQGVGLGLSISRELARAMGGDLTAESTLGEGSTFTLVLVRHDPTAVRSIGNPLTDGAQAASVRPLTD